MRNFHKGCVNVIVIVLANVFHVKIFLSNAILFKFVNNLSFLKMKAYYEGCVKKSKVFKCLEDSF